MRELKILGGENGDFLYASLGYPQPHWSWQEQENTNQITNFKTTEHMIPRPHNYVSEGKLIGRYLMTTQ